MGLGSEYLKLLNEEGSPGGLQTGETEVGQDPAAIWNAKVSNLIATNQPEPTKPQFVPYDQRKFKNVVEKQKYWDQLPGKYGNLVKGRENYLDTWVRNIPKKSKATKHDINTAETESLPVSLQEMHKEYLENKKMSESITNDSIPNATMEQLNGMWDRRAELSRRNADIRRTWHRSPENQDYEEADPVTWSNFISNNKGVKDPVLLFASLMDEGGDKFSEDEYYKGDLRGYTRFGLDTFGDRMNEFIEKGYIDPSMSERVKFRKRSNELGSTVTAPRFSNMEDVLQAKNAFVTAGNLAINKKAGELGVTLSKDAEDYFTIVSYNRGEKGAADLMEYYKEQGWLDNEEFLKNEDLPLEYPQKHRNALRRMQAAKMIKGEYGILPWEEPTIPMRDGGIIEKPTKNNDMSRGGIVSIKPIVAPSHEEGGVAMVKNDVPIRAEGGEFELTLADGTVVVFNKDQMAQLQSGVPLEEILATMPEFQAQDNVGEVVADQGLIASSGDDWEKYLRQLKKQEGHISTDGSLPTERAEGLLDLLQTDPNVKLSPDKQSVYFGGKWLPNPYGLNPGPSGQAPVQIPNQVPAGNTNALPVEYRTVDPKASTVLGSGVSPAAAAAPAATAPGPFKPTEKYQVHPSMQGPDDASNLWQSKQNFSYSLAKGLRGISNSAHPGGNIVRGLPPDYNDPPDQMLQQLKTRGLVDDNYNLKDPSLTLSKDGLALLDKTGKAVYIYNQSDITTGDYNLSTGKLKEVKFGPGGDSAGGGAPAAAAATPQTTATPSAPASQTTAPPATPPPTTPQSQTEEWLRKIQEVLPSERKFNAEKARRLQAVGGISALGDVLRTVVQGVGGFKGRPLWNMNIGNTPLTALNQYEKMVEDYDTRRLAYDQLQMRGALEGMRLDAYDTRQARDHANQNLIVDKRLASDAKLQGERLDSAATLQDDQQAARIEEIIKSGEVTGDIRQKEHENTMERDQEVSKLRKSEAASQIYNDLEAYKKKIDHAKEQGVSLSGTDQSSTAENDHYLPIGNNDYLSYDEYLDVLNTLTPDEMEDQNGNRLNSTQLDAVVKSRFRQVVPRHWDDETAFGNLERILSNNSAGWDVRTKAAIEMLKETNRYDDDQLRQLQEQLESYGSYDEYIQQTTAVTQ